MRSSTRASAFCSDRISVSVAIIPDGVNRTFLTCINKTVLFGRDCKSKFHLRILMRSSIVSPHDFRFPPGEFVKCSIREARQMRIRVVCLTLEELMTAIGDYIDLHNERPKSFIWTAKAASILEKVKRARASLNNRQSV